MGKGDNLFLKLLIHESVINLQTALKNFNELTESQIDELLEELYHLSIFIKEFKKELR